MSEVSEKFCEECGKVNEIEARFCKTCGNQFPEINNPQFQEAITKEKMDQQSILPEMGTSQPHQNAQNNSFHPPNQFQQHGSYQRKPPGFPGMMLPTRVWGGKGLIDAILQMFKNPAKTAPELLEDPTAPSPM
ncbi:MAG: zinc ribbon domain-containing protein, partial [Candidatus Heimdallarchaeota archaeon]|nr:zinc ribbon domain-containing protein [Candidatus Heimdallarchaeota archaeon]